VTEVATVETSDLSGHLAREVRSTALAMAGYGTSNTELRPLHELLRWCEAVLASSPGEVEVVVPMYLLSRFLDDALDNLTGDFLYDANAHEFKTSFFRGLVQDLDELGKAGFERPELWAPLLRRSLDGYLRVVDSLNVRAEEGLLDAAGPPSKQSAVKVPAEAMTMEGP